MFTTSSLHKRQAESLSESYLSEIERAARAVSGKEGITAVFERTGFDPADFLAYCPDSKALEEFVDFTKDEIWKNTGTHDLYFSNLVNAGMRNKNLMASIALLSAFGLACGCVGIPVIGKEPTAM